jgi:cell division protein FtsN
MVWIVALSAAWFGAFVMLLALAMVASRSDRPTADHLARLRSPRPRVVWLPPQPDRDRLF